METVGLATAPCIFGEAHSMDEITEYYRVVKSAFEKLAPYYDVVAAPIARVREQAADLLPQDSHLRILDVATGTGAQALAFARRGHSVIGIDLSEAMLAVAQKHRVDSRLTFQLADATALPFADDHFDVCSISFALHDMPLSVRQCVLDEMVRVTRPDGKVVVIDYGLPENRLGNFLIYRLISLYEGEYYRQFIRTELRALLNEAGITATTEQSAVLGAARILIGLPGEKSALSNPSVNYRDSVINAAGRLT
jgi:ubiquinone/menaquinone biosynthesis C-methylase UbiE